MTGTQVVEKFEPVHVGEVVIEQNDVRMERRAQVEPFVARDY